ncbi:MAG TPA: hypothetical protein VFB22_11690 [Candidatus Baltobacteraceae bacterium]|nr:hypothetical protein [Candidatus Baltobacteraceae bacterium]
MGCWGGRRATPRSSCSDLRRRLVARTLSAALLAWAMTVSPHAVTAQADHDAAAVERGRSAGRVLVLLRNPFGCAIIVLRARCIADVDAFFAGRSDGDFANVPNVGKHPVSGLRAFVSEGDRGGYDPALAYLDTRVADATLWHDDPRSAALYDAGIEDVLLPSVPRGDPSAEPGVTQMLQLGPFADLVRHAGAIPTGAIGVSADDLSRFASNTARDSWTLVGSRDALSAMVSAAHRVTQSVDTAHPAPPLVPLPDRDGSLGDALLGVETAVADDLSHSGPWLGQSDAQAFLDRYFDRLERLDPSLRPLCSAARDDLRYDAHYSAASAREGMHDLVAALQTSPRAARMEMGWQAEELGFAAVIVRDGELSATMLRSVSRNDALDDAVPGFREARLSAVAVSPTDWGAQYRLSVHLVDLLLRAANG